MSAIHPALLVSLPNPVPWLLEGDDPSVRFFTLTDLLGSSPDSPEAAAARRDIMSRGAVPRILAAQGDDGHWEGRDRFYTAKYRGTVWQLIILAELGADGSDERVRRGCEAVLRDAQDRLSGGFATDRAKKGDGGLHSRVIPCLTGNMVFSLIRLGLLDDPRVQAAVDWLTTYARFDDGDGEAAARDAPGWPYDAWEMCWGRHTCHMGVVKTLKGLAEIPPERRSPAVQATLDDGAEFLLRHHVHKRSHDLARDSKPGWRRSAFRACIRPTCSRSSASWRSSGGRATSARAQPARSSPPRPTPRALEAAGHLQRPLRRRHRDQGRAQPLGHAAGTPGPEGPGGGDVRKNLSQGRRRACRRLRSRVRRRFASP